jgi:hypothetical protein
VPKANTPILTVSAGDAAKTETGANASQPKKDRKFMDFSYKKRLEKPLIKPKKSILAGLKVRFIVPA